LELAEGKRVDISTQVRETTEMMRKIEATHEQVDQVDPTAFQALQDSLETNSLRVRIRVSSSIPREIPLSRVLLFLMLMNLVFSLSFSLRRFVQSTLEAPVR
jgi:hypothetical protein